MKGVAKSVRCSAAKNGVMKGSTIPKEKDVQDAIEYFNESFRAPAPYLSVQDFSRLYLGELTVRQLYQYDDVDAWLDFSRQDGEGLTPSQRLEAMTSFRGPAWVARAKQWLSVGIPAIVVVEGPDSEGRRAIAIGDGRGRINFASMMRKRLHVWKLTYRKPKR